MNDEQLQTGKPIIFSAESVRAIYDGRKTQTRRILKPQPQKCQIHAKCPYGIGELLWVRETFAPCGDAGAVWFKAGIPEFRAGRETGKWIDFPYALDNEIKPPSNLKWRSPIYMPRWASRITLRVVDVWAERVQNIGHFGAMSEGITYDYASPGGGTIMQFAKLWDSINAKRGYPWDHNPWVWVVEFEKVQR